jgi:hypothetical protein
VAKSPHRFPPPWRADTAPGGHVVRDATGQALAYVYSRDNEDEARQAKGADQGRGEADRHQHRAAAGAARQGGSRLNSVYGAHEARYDWSRRAAELAEARGNMPRLAWRESPLPQ